MAAQTAVFPPAHRRGRTSAHRPPGRGSHLSGLESSRLLYFKSFFLVLSLSGGAHLPGVSEEREVIVLRPCVSESSCFNVRLAGRFGGT